MQFNKKLGVSYFKETPLIENTMPCMAYDKRKKIKRPCTLSEYDSENAIVYWKDTNRKGKISLELLEFNGIIPKGEDIIKIGLIIDSTECWKCQQISEYIIGVEVIYDNQYIQFHTNINDDLKKLFNQNILNQHKLSSAIQKCTKTQWKYVPLRNTHLAEISNNPASRFCFNL